MAHPRASVRAGTAVLAVLLVVSAGGWTVQGAVAATSTAPSADAAETVSRCTEITEPGAYEIDEEFGAAGFEPSRPCIRITADDVVLDGGGQTIVGPGATNTTGIQIIGASNVTVRNVEVVQWQRGISYKNASGGEMRNVTTTSNVYGVVVSDSTGVVAQGVNVSGNLVGLRLANTANTDFGTVDTGENHIGGVYSAIRIDSLLFSKTYGPPVDRDGDGHAEDVTGDGDVTIGDRFAVFTVVTTSYFGSTDLTDDQVRSLDFDGNGSLGFGDVLAF